MKICYAQGVAEAECRRAADAAEGAYNQAFNKQVASELEALNEEHQRCMTLARQAYAEGAIGSPLPCVLGSLISVSWHGKIFFNGLLRMGAFNRQCGASKARS